MSKIIWDGEREAVIKEMADTRFTYRTAEGVAENTGLDKEKVGIIIETLVNEGIAKLMPGAGKIRQWGLKSRVSTYSGYGCAG